MKRLLKTLALVGVLAAALTGCGRQTQEQMAADVGKAMEAALPKDFAKLEFEERPAYASKPAPTLVFRGAESTILAVSKPSLRDHWGTWMNIAGLAVTKNGRWYEFSYDSELQNDDGFLASKPCLATDCRRFGSVHSVSLVEAKRWYFDSDQFTPERYHALFGETAPAKREPA
jgi:hypothetical protein